MKKNRVSKASFLVVLTLLLALLASTTVAAQETIPDQGSIATITVQENVIIWQAQIEGAEYALTISGPSDFYLQQEYLPGTRITFRPRDRAGAPLPDGVYTYEILALSQEEAVEYDETQRGLAPAAEARVQSGSFSVLDGEFVTQDVTDSVVDSDPGVLAINDQVILDDLIVDGSLCVGFDCVNGESFGFDTIRLKENNLRIHFQDTSTSASFPTNDWRLSINDSANGGASYFAIQDVDNGTNVFVVEASAGSNALYVDDYGRVGLGTSTPAVELEVRDSDTPSVRLNQDGSGGWSPQTWDMAGNEANFFIRDVTNGSQLPFRIQPGADSNALTIRSDNKIGIGTWSPTAPLHVQRNDGTARILVEDTSSGAQDLLMLQNNGPSRFALVNTASSGTSNTWRFNNASDGILRVAADDGDVEWTLDQNGNLTILGSLTQNSDVNVKENFAAVNPREVLATVVDLPISSWNFKFDDPSLRHLGPMAQDFYQAFGLGADETGIAPLDTSGVALAAVQGLYEIVGERDAQISALQEQNADLQARLTALEQDLDQAPQTPLSSILLWVLGGVLLLAALGVTGKRLYSARA